MTYRFRATAPLTRDWRHFRYAEADGVATVTLNRPEKLNPLTFESYADLRDLLAELPHHEDVRALVIRGEGRAFCGGGDVNEIIGELIKMDARDLMRFTKMTGDVIRAMRECPVPIIAAVHGIAAGAGAVVALAARLPGSEWCAALLLGGSLSHLIETFRRGRVCDYLCLRFWPAFNLADAAISIGTIGFVVQAIRALVNLLH